MGNAARILSLCALIAGLFGAAARADTALECELLGAVIESIHAAPGMPLNIAKETGADMVAGDFARFKKDFPALKRETYRAFTDNNKAPSAVDCAGVKPDGRDPVISDEQAPQGTSKWAISRAGIDVEGAQALFYAGYLCGPLCGAGSVYLLERKDGKWTITGQSMVWIS